MTASPPTEPVASSSRDPLSPAPALRPRVEEDGSTRATSFDLLQEDDGHVGVADVDEDSCLICLGSIDDRSVLPACQHSLFCFACIARWIGIHRRCPLCSTAVGSYIIHSIRSDDDYVRHRLQHRDDTDTSQRRSDEDESSPLRTTAEEILRRRQAPRRARTEARGGQFQLDALLRWEQQLSVRRRVYRQKLYCQHVGSNRASRLASPPTPSAVASTPSLQSMLLRFARRDLLAYPSSNLDIDFLATYAISVFKTLDIKSNESVGLLSEFLGTDGAQHFCHEVYSFARFITAGAGAYPDKLASFDAWAHYAWPEESITDRRRKEQQQQAQLAERATLTSEEMSDREGSDDLNTAPPRAEVIQRRARLLGRLEAERKQLDVGGDGETHRNALLQKEHLLRSQLLDKRKRARDDTLTA